MNSSDYWKKRFEAIETSAVSKGEQYYSTLEKEYFEASRAVEAEISTWYQRFAANNEISLADARRLLNGNEMKEFKWTVQDYINYGEENAINGTWMKQLENASAKVHISRLESLKIQMQQQIEVLYGNQVDGIDKLAKKIYNDTYYHTAYEIQKGFNVGWTLQSFNEKQLEKVLSKPWTSDNMTFRDKCWKRKDELVATVQNQLTQGILKGDSPDKAIKAISEKFKVDKSKAGRLIMTESAYFAADAQRKCFQDLDVEKVEIVATLDSHTSEICQGMDGKVVDIKDYQPGVTVPPFHPWCRSTTVPYFPDNYGERAARNEKGETYYVPSDMTYGDWKEKFAKDAVSGEDKKLFVKYCETLGKNAPKTIEDFLSIRYSDKEWSMFKSYTNSIKSGELTALADFDLYKSKSSEIDRVLVGISTKNDLTITQKSNHFISRTIGSISQRRSGVDVYDALDTLINPIKIDPIKVDNKGKSQRFKGKTSYVTVNTDTGKLIQANPHKGVT